MESKTSENSQENKHTCKQCNKKYINVIYEYCCIHYNLCDKCIEYNNNINKDNDDYHYENGFLDDNFDMCAYCMMNDSYRSIPENIPIIHYIGVLDGKSGKELFECDYEDHLYEMYEEGYNYGKVINENARLKKENFRLKIDAINITYNIIPNDLFSIVSSYV